MQQPSLSEIDQIRMQGFRPQVVGCFLHNKKILFLFQKKYQLWQLPQGGIEKKETLEQAFFREMTEELGEIFTASYNQKITIIGQDQMEFPPNTQNIRELKNDAGQNIFMKGKKYFFISTQTTDEKIEIRKTEFDNYKWVTFTEAKTLCDTIYQQGKQRITIKALQLLKEKSLL